MRELQQLGEQHVPTVGDALLLILAATSYYYYLLCHLPLPTYYKPAASYQLL